MMNFFEAMTALQNGRKVRALGWAVGEWIGLKEQQFKLFGLPKSSYQIIDEKGTLLENSMFLSNVVSQDWEEFVEVKK